MNTFNTFLNWYQRHRAIAELSALSDTLLTDIGISRDQIPAVVDGLQVQRKIQPAAVAKPAVSRTDVALSGA